MENSEMDRRFRFTVLRPLDGGAGAVTALELPAVGQEHAALLRQVLAPHLGAGFILTIDDEIVARGPDPHGLSALRSTLDPVQRVTEMAVQQHEYLCAELRRMRQEYEEEFAQERAILRTLRQRWIERICDDQVRGEDALRFIVETARTAMKKNEPPPTTGT